MRRSPFAIVTAALAIGALCTGCDLDLFEPKVSSCGPPKVYDEDEALPQIGTSAQQLAAAFEREQTLDFAFRGTPTEEDGFAFAAFPAYEDEVVTLTFEDEGDPFEVPWSITTDGVCHERDPTKDVKVHVRSKSGLLDEDATAHLRIQSGRLVASFSTDELHGEVQAYVEKLALKRSMSAKWHFRLSFTDDGSVTDLALRLEVKGSVEGGIMTYGKMAVGAGYSREPF